MNIFALDKDPANAAKMHIDTHCVKMIVETAQLLSTAHRVLDGTYTELMHPVTNKIRKFYVLPGEEVWFLPNATGFEYNIKDPICYRHSHMSHPCGKWIQETSSNYQWAFTLMEELVFEFNRRYGHSHGTERLIPFLRNLPSKIKTGGLTPFALAMPEQYKVEDAIQSYKNYYIGEKVSFAKWTNTPVPTWFLEGVGEQYNESSFARTR